MKFDGKNAIEKQMFGVKILEYCTEKAGLPIDCAIAQFRKAEYPLKKNHNFYEMFFVLDGKCEIVMHSETTILEKSDVFIVPIGIEHIIRAEYADILIACSPQFDPKNVEFL